MNKFFLFLSIIFILASQVVYCDDNIADYETNRAKCLSRNGSECIKFEYCAIPMTNGCNSTETCTLVNNKFLCRRDKPFTNTYIYRSKSFMPSYLNFPYMPTYKSPIVEKYSKRVRNDYFIPIPEKSRYYQRSRYMPTIITSDGNIIQSRMRRIHKIH